ncbi:MAG TPA: ABC transporter substrate-binding protein [Ramlibacter sp.]|nr:ABC transporter substrate-binding protein [Ramlibacter sp.]
MTHIPASLSRRRLLLAGAAAGLAAPHLGAQAPTKITISYPTRSGASWPLWLAKQGGFYERHGLDVTLEFGVHPAGVAMLVSGQAQMINYGLEQILTASLRDPTFTMVGSSLSKGSFALIAQKGLSKVQDLKGKRIGIGRLGDPLYTFTLDLIQKSGMGARDVVWVPTGTDAVARAKMLEGGQLDASLMVAPAYFRLEAQGFSVVDLLANHPDIFVSTAYVFRKQWAQSNPDTVLRLVMAQTEAIARFYEDKAAAVQAYRAYDPQPEPDVARIYDMYKAKDVLDRVPLLQKAAVESAIARQADDVPGIRNLQVQQVIDMGPVRKLVADGYFRKVFGAGVAAEEQRKLAASF